MSDPATPGTGTEAAPATPATPGTPAASPPPAQPAADPPPSPEPKPTETVDFWKQQAREQEKRAKSNASAAKELEKLRASMMSDTEKAVAEAEARGRQAATTEVGQRLAAAEIKAALTGVVANPAEIVDDLNLAKYVTDNGEVDTEAIAALRKKFEGLAGKSEPAPTNGQRPKENLRTVPLGTTESASKTDMNEWMRRRVQP